MRETVLHALGLVTQPNEFGQYPTGANSIAHNVLFRDAGIVDSRPASTRYLDAAAATGHIIRRMWAGSASLLAASDDGAFASHLRWVTALASTLITFPETGAFVSAVGKVQSVQSRGRYYVTTEHGVFSLASEGATSAFLAGFPPPRFVGVQGINTVDARAIESNKGASWVALFTRKGVDGSYLKVGPPSTATRIDNFLSTMDVQFRIRWPAVVSANLLVGDQVELYRTRTQDTGTDPGGDFYLARTATLTSGDIANHYVAITDDVSDASLGVALYTNDEEGGATSAKYPPGYAVDLANFKGHTFYVEQKVAAYDTVRVPGPWGLLTTDAERVHGIGTRTFTGDLGAGSPTIASVSNMKGIAVGQLVDDLLGSNVPASTTITAINVGASTITMSANSVGAAVGTSLRSEDMIEVDGTLQTAKHPYYLLDAVGTGISTLLRFDQAAYISTSGAYGETMTGVELTTEATWYRYNQGTLRATNGANYSPPLPSLSGTPQVQTQDLRKNRLAISELDQPEARAFGEGSELLIGSGEIHRIISTTDALWVFCSDGLYRVSGEFPTWRVDPVDSTLVLAGRNCVDVLQGLVWAFTNRGLVVLQPSGAVVQVSEGLIGTELPGLQFAETWARMLVCDDAHREVHVLVDGGDGYVWNTATNAWCTTDYDRQDPYTATALAYVPFLREVAWGARHHLVGLPAIEEVRYAGDSDEEYAAQNADLIFQPVTGDGQPFTLKNWIDCTFVIEAAENMGVLARFNGIAFASIYRATLLRRVVGSAARAIVAVPSELSGEPMAIGVAIAVGFTVDTFDSEVGVDYYVWRFKGLSLRWVLAAEETNARAS